jgi:isopentenyl-diphosphate delta-isomerase type 1
MNEQILLLVDKNDNFQGTARRSECHNGLGKPHRGFVVFLFNNSGEILIQFRNKEKVGGGRWDGSAGSHVLDSENYQVAAERCLRNEFGIDYHENLIDCGAFVYEEHFGKDSENEYCKVFVGEWNGEFIPNKDEMSKAKFVNLNQIIRDFKNDADYKIYTKWFHLALEKFLSHPFSDKFKKL